MDMNKVMVIATGGSIASRRNIETQGMSSGVISGDELLSLIPDLDPALPIEVQNMFGVPGSYLGPDKMLPLARTI